MTTRKQTYIDILTTAYEDGAIDYWAATTPLRWDQGMPSFDVRDWECRRDPWVPVDSKAIAKAFSALSRGEVIPHRQAYWRKAYRDAATGNFDFDAEDVDILVQIAAFDDIVFG